MIPPFANNSKRLDANDDIIQPANITVKCALMSMYEITLKSFFGLLFLHEECVSSQPGLTVVCVLFLNVDFRYGPESDNIFNLE